MTGVEAFIERYSSWNGLLQPGLVMLSKVVGVMVTALLFYILYRYPPVATLSNRALIIASVTGTVLFQFTKWGSHGMSRRPRRTSNSTERSED